MPFLTHLTISLISLVAIVLSCVFFTNAIEILGNKLKLGNNATGSILAVMGTGLPEFIVPIVAILGVGFSNIKIEVAQNIALGAILGSPFMLLTLALFMLAFILLFKKRKEITVDYSVILRDYKYFLLAYFVAILFSFKFLNEYKILAFILLIILYAFFVFRTIVKSRQTCVECECERLYLNFKNEKLAIFLQLFFSLLVLILASHFFVGEIKYFSLMLGISPAILALIVTPFATELPECINSLIWLKDNKDDLAIANILGAVVFQATIVFAFGILLTPWLLNKELFINALVTFFGATLFLLFTFKTKKIVLANLLFCGIIYFAYLIFIFIK